MMKTPRHSKSTHSPFCVTHTKPFSNSIVAAIGKYLQICIFGVFNCQLRPNNGLCTWQIGADNMLIYLCYSIAAYCKIYRASVQKQNHSSLAPHCYLYEYLGHGQKVENNNFLGRCDENLTVPIQVNRNTFPFDKQKNVLKLQT